MCTTTPHVHFSTACFKGSLLNQTLEWHNIVMCNVSKYRMILAGLTAVTWQCTYSVCVCVWGGGVGALFVWGCMQLPVSLGSCILCLDTMPRLTRWQPRERGSCSQCEWDEALKALCSTNYPSIQRTVVYTGSDCKRFLADMASLLCCFPATLNLQ